MDNSEKINLEINSCLQEKYDFAGDLQKALKKMDKNKIFELLIENGVNDVRFANKLNYLSKGDPDGPLTEEVLEKMKFNLFRMMK